MLIAILIGVIFALSGESPEVIRDRIAEFVQDETRREAALVVVANTSTTTEEYIQGALELVGRLEAVHMNHASTDAEYEAVFDAATESRSAAQQQLLANREELKKTLTREEWAQVFQPASAD